MHGRRDGCMGQRPEAVGALAQSSIAGLEALDAAVRARLTRVLGERRACIIEEWVNTLRGNGAPGYAALSNAEMEDSLGALFDADIAFLERPDPEHLETLVAAVARVRFAQGFTAASLEEGIAAMRTVVLPIVIHEFADDPSGLTAAMEAILKIEEIASVRVAKVYQEVVGAEIIAAQNTAHRAEHEKVEFCREMVRAATQERLVICDHRDIPAPAGAEALPVCAPRDVRKARHRGAALAESSGLDSDASHALQLCIGEAGTNALRHAGGACFHVWREADGAVTFQLADNGPGIDLNRIPLALRPGFSTGSSLGMGFTLMLQLADKILLATDASGTTLQLTVGPGGKGSVPYLPSLV